MVQLHTSGRYNIRRDFTKSEQYKNGTVHDFSLWRNAQCSVSGAWPEPDVEWSLSKYRFVHCVITSSFPDILEVILKDSIQLGAMNIEHCCWALSHETWQNCCYTFQKVSKNISPLLQKLCKRCNAKNFIIFPLHSSTFIRVAAKMCANCGIREF